MSRPGLRGIFFGVIALVFAAVATAVLGSLPVPHTPLHYLMAGCCATCVALLLGFAAVHRVHLGPPPGAIPVRRPAGQGAPGRHEDVNRESDHGSGAG